MKTNKRTENVYSSEFDDVMVEKILDGDRRTFFRLYRQLKPMLERYVAKKVSRPKDAEEIVQDSFVAFLDAMPLFSGRSSLWTFLVSIARHEVADYYRKRYAKRAIRAVPLLNHLYDERLHSASETARDLNKMVEVVYAGLTPKYARVLRLKYEDELSVRQIARKLKISAKAAESLLYRARTAFQEDYVNRYGQPAFSVAGK